jgi:hypothetical protein
MLESFNIDRVVQSDYYSWYQSPGIGSGKKSKEVVDVHEIVAGWYVPVKRLEQIYPLQGGGIEI